MLHRQEHDTLKEHALASRTYHVQPCFRMDFLTPSDLLLKHITTQESRTQDHIIRKLNLVDLDQAL